MAEDEKVRENRLRRMAERQGYVLQKSRRRDPHALDYGRWRIVDPDTGGVVAGAGYSKALAYRFDLDDVEAWLTDYENEEEHES